MPRWVIISLAGILCVTIVARGWLNRWVDQTIVPPLAQQTSRVVLDRDGQLLRAFTVADGRWRLPVTLADVDQTYLNLLIQMEDKRFYQHSGVDAIALVRAGLQALMSGRIVSGGSTLTMQVARLLENSGTGRWEGKIRQIRLAWALESGLSKESILSLYLHLAPFGGNLEGVRAASLSWFDREPKRLTLAQAALLVALPQSPETRRPDRFATPALRARNRVLDRAGRTGFISQREIEMARSERLPQKRYPFPALAPHLSERLVQEYAIGPVLTTIHKAAQARIQKLAFDHVKSLGEKLSAAMLVVDHTTGKVLVSVGAAEYTNLQSGGFIDMTRAIRSPGSTLKPLIYGMSFDQGLAHPETLIEDRPTRYGTYSPQNFDKKFRGTLSVRNALQLSLNIPAVSLLETIGPARFLSSMRRAGLKPVLPSHQPPGLAVGLGGLGLTLEDLAKLYGSIANGGRVLALNYFAWGKNPPGPRILEPRSAWYVTDILSGVAPPSAALPGQIAYKTGTSYGHRDAWAVGYDGQHVIAVWIGRVDGAAMPGALGADVAAPLLFDGFATLKPQLAPPLPPPPQTSLTVSHLQLPTTLQHFQRNRALFARQSEPEILFPRHGTRVQISSVNPELALKVGNGTPPFTWLANGVPVFVASYERQILLTPDQEGSLTLSVVDSKGRSERAEITLLAVQ